VSNVVITVLVYFNDLHRQANQDASTILEMNMLRVINELIDATTAYDFDKKSSGERNVLICDVSESTSDVPVDN
jgi:heat shock protein 1/8